MFPWTSNARSYSRRIPITFTHGEGCFLFDSQGRPYLDFLTSAGASILGHHHPCISQALRQHATGFTSHLDLNTTLESAFVNELLPLLPFSKRERVRIHFCAPTGSDAIEAALKLARLATARNSIWAFMGSYHGMTQGALSVTSNRELRRVGLHGAHDVVFFPFPSARLDAPPYDTDERAVELTTYLLELAISDDHSGIEKPAAILIELVQGEGGVNVAPAPFMKFLRSFCDRHEILLICDEIQSGLGRTGHWFACQRFQIEPDILCISKGIGGGLPLSLLAFQERLNTWPPGTHIGTFRGPSVSIACGTEIMRFAQGNAILKNVRDRSDELFGKLRTLKDRYRIIRSVRGLGLFAGVEFSSERDDFPPYFNALLLENGLLAEMVGRKDMTLKLLPPLNLDQRALGEFFDKFENAIQKAS